MQPNISGHFFSSRVDILRRVSIVVIHLPIKSICYKLEIFSIKLPEFWGVYNNFRVCNLWTCEDMIIYETGYCLLSAVLHILSLREILGTALSLQFNMGEKYIFKQQHMPNVFASSKNISSANTGEISAVVYCYDHNKHIGTQNLLLCQWIDQNCKPRLSGLRLHVWPRNPRRKTGCWFWMEWWELCSDPRSCDRGPRLDFCLH